MQNSNIGEEDYTIEKPNIIYHYTRYWAFYSELEK